MDTLPDMPMYWLCVMTMLGFSGYFAMHIREGWALPAIGVLATVGAWYLMDVIYNDYDSYAALIGESAVASAWWQVWLFLIAFGFIVRPVARYINRRRFHRQSQFVSILTQRSFERPSFQRVIDRLVYGFGSIWLLVVIVGLSRVDWDVAGMMAPYLGHRADPWGRDRLGGGLDALLSLAGYLQLFCASALGALFALARRPSTRLVAGVLSFLAIPYFVFHLRRNVILISVVPTILAWVFARFKGPIWARVMVLLPFAYAINLWFGFIIENRSSSSIAEAFASGKFSEVSNDRKHKGLNMFEELAWINFLRDTGAFELNLGQRYLAEISNPIPRALWPGKPTIGLDYAVARGFGSAGGSASSGGVVATISTGMIGQGVTCFGGVLGSVCSALLMSLWVALLTRLDLVNRDPGSLVIYMLGCILTFNLGRDITLLNLYPMIFGMVALEVMRRMSKRKGSHLKRKYRKREKPGAVTDP